MNLFAYKNVIMMSPWRTESKNEKEFDIIKYIFVSTKTLRFLFYDKKWEDGHKQQRFWSRFISLIFLTENN